MIAGIIKYGKHGADEYEAKTQALDKPSKRGNNNKREINKDTIQEVIYEVTY